MLNLSYIITTNSPRSSGLHYPQPVDTDWVYWRCWKLYYKYPRFTKTSSLCHRILKQHTQWTNGRRSPLCSFLQESNRRYVQEPTSGSALGHMQPITAANLAPEVAAEHWLQWQHLCHWLWPWWLRCQLLFHAWHAQRSVCQLLYDCMMILQPDW